MSLVRKYKLWKLGIPQNDEAALIFNFVENSLFNLKSSQRNGFPDDVNYKNPKTCMMCYHIKDKEVTINHELINRVLENKYDLNRETIMGICKEVVIRFYKLDIKTIKPAYMS